MKNLLKFITTRRIASVVAGVAMVGMLVGGNVGTAFAAGSPGTPDTGDGTFTIGGGTLSDTMGSIVINSNNPVAISGINQDIPIVLPIAVADPTGTGNGWHITIKATQFATTGGTVHSLAGVPAVTAVPQSLPVGTAPTNTILSYTGFAVPVDGTSAAIPLYSAATSTGMGSVTLTPTMTVPVTANAFAGSYTSTFTVGIVSGP